jgi:hypothetical protein
LGTEEVAREVHLAHRILLTLFDADGDVDVLAIRRDLDVGRVDLHVDVAVVEVVARDPQDVDLEGVLAVGAGAGQERDEAALLGDEPRLQDVVGEVRLPTKRICRTSTFAFSTTRRRPPPDVLAHRLDLGADLGQVEALLVVEVFDLLDVLLDLGLVQDGEGLDVHHLLDVVVADLVVALGPRPSATAGFSETRKTRRSPPSAGRSRKACTSSK